MLPHTVIQSMMRKFVFAVIWFALPVAQLVIGQRATGEPPADCVANLPVPVTFETWLTVTGALGFAYGVAVAMIMLCTRFDLVFKDPLWVAIEVVEFFFRVAWFGAGCFMFLQSCPTVAPRSLYITLWCSLAGTLVSLFCLCPRSLLVHTPPSPPLQRVPSPPRPFSAY